MIPSPAPLPGSVVRVGLTRVELGWVAFMLLATGWSRAASWESAAFCGLVTGELCVVDLINDAFCVEFTGSKTKFLCCLRRSIYRPVPLSPTTKATVPKSVILSDSGGFSIVNRVQPPRGITRGTITGELGVVSKKSHKE